MSLELFPVLACRRGLQCPSVVARAVGVPRCLDMRLSCRRGESSLLLPTPICGCLLGFSVPLGSVQLWEDGTLLLSSASMGLCQDCFCLLLLCPLQLTMGWELSLILLLGSGTDFMVCTSVGRGFHPSICSQGPGSVIPWC